MVCVNMCSDGGWRNFAFIIHHKQPYNKKRKFEKYCDSNCDYLRVIDFD